MSNYHRDYNRDNFVTVNYGEDKEDYGDLRPVGLSSLKIDRDIET